VPQFPHLQSREEGVAQESSLGLNILSSGEENSETVVPHGQSRAL
jgi:hypothetical protein